MGGLTTCNFWGYYYTKKCEEMTNNGYNIVAYFNGNFNIWNLKKKIHWMDLIAEQSWEEKESVNFKLQQQKLSSLKNKKKIIEKINRPLGI